METKEEKNLRRTTNFNADRDLAMFDELQELNDSAQIIVDVLKDIESIKKQIAPVKGVDYFDGDDGVTPVKGRDYFTPKEIEQIKREVTPVKGIHYFDGKDADMPVKGKDYFDGKDGSPDTPEQIIAKIRLVPKGKKLTPQDIDGLEPLLTKVVQPQGGKGLGGMWFGSANQFAVKSAGVEIGREIKSINFQGSAVASVVNNNGDVTITIQQGGGGGGVTFETPSGLVDGSNQTFTVLNTPAYIVSDGVTYFENSGYSRSGLTLTLDMPPSVFIKSAY